MICKNCGKENREDANFCVSCSQKLRNVCNCWVKKMPYDCGLEKCPGLRLCMVKEDQQNSGTDRRRN